MTIDIYSVALAIVASIASGLGTAIYASRQERRKETIREAERYQDHLKLELKDLKIQLYQLEKDLTEWKDKYYSTVQDLISVKSELEEALIKIALVDMQLKES